MTHINRKVYGIFMLLSDIGGFICLFYGMGALFMRIFNFNSAENFLINRLYVSASQDKDSKNDQSNVLDNKR